VAKLINSDEESVMLNPTKSRNL